MGIVNVTPDSFSDGGQYNSLTSAVDHALSLIEAGADILDIGGESTRPGATPVSVQEELDRTIPVVEALAKRSDVPLSIDTTKAEVARQAVAAGASIINDISGMTFDVQMVDVASRSQAGICLMHIKGTPQTMQQDPHYDNVVREVSDFLAARIQVCVAAGISRERICIDPGIGFGKTADHNLTLMKSIPFLRQTHHCPVLIGHSRKRFLSKILGRAVEERTAGTIGVSVALAENGADLLRVHDVRATRDALIAWKAVRL
ncbi:MAG: dihydropteroate synthase [Planctomycetaceae bacterium]|nr:dihydropteroate synthase [Planctomycetaceae bacterium]